MAAIERKWNPHPLQQRILASDARYRICPLGRRTGKTVLCRGETIEYALENPSSFVWWVAPTYDDANEVGYDYIERMLPDALIEKRKRSEPRKLHLSNGSIISFRSAERRKSLSGRGLDYLVIDEAGDVPDHVWRNDLRPSLTGSDNFGSDDMLINPDEIDDDRELGRMVAIGTPEGRGWFHKAYLRGDDTDHPEWKSFRGSAYDNPWVPDSEIEKARGELPERVFRQQYLGEFVDEEGAVFGNVRERNVYPTADDDGDNRLALDMVVETWRGEDAGVNQIGVDIARQSNFFVAIALDGQARLVDMIRFTGGSWNMALKRVKKFFERNAPANAYLDSTRDNKLIEDLDRMHTNVAINNFNFGGAGGKKKADMVENLAARLETGEITLPPEGAPGPLGDPLPIDQLLVELEAFEYEVTRAQNVRYGAPENFNDDCVDALGLAAMNTGPASATW